MEVIVMGAGIIGVTTAWFLRKNGHDVRVIEQREAPGLVTSFANAGQVSANLADPWANPTTLRTVMSWLFRDDTPLVFRPKADIHQWTWLVKFLRQCTKERYHGNLVNLANLGVYSRTALQGIRAETGLRYDDTQRGILLFFTEEDKLQGAAAAARRLAADGLRREVLDAEQCLELEPSLQSVRDQLKGGIYSRYDETGDAFKFTQALAELAKRDGVNFEFGSTVEKIRTRGGRIESVQIVRSDGTRETATADAYVLCMGTAAASMARTIGINLDIYPVKGYSVTFPVREGGLAVSMGLTDAANKVAFSRLGDRVRATAIAEITGYDLSIDERQCQQIVARANDLFPNALDTSQAKYWAGLRPMTPSNLPYIGRSSQYQNFFTNAGHGTIGWTQSCGSAQAVADILDGRRPDCDYPFLGVAH